MANIISFGGCGSSSAGAPTIYRNFTWTGADGTYQIVDDGDKNWRLKFLSSGIFTPKKNMLIDVFVVGGGGGGFYEDKGSGPHVVGGGSGYTKTEKSIFLEKGKEYTITVGLGTGSSGQGGTTSGFNVTAVGGYGGGHSTLAGKGGSGGSEMVNPGTKFLSGGKNGANGNIGGTASWGDLSGQGTTTYEFEDSTLELYANGGDASVYVGSGIGPGRDNYGDGGDASDSVTYQGTDGVLIIRNHRE